METVDLFGKQVPVKQGTCTVCDRDGRVIDVTLGLICANPLLCLMSKRQIPFSDQAKEQSIATFGE